MNSSIDDSSINWKNALSNPLLIQELDQIQTILLTPKQIEQVSSEKQLPLKEAYQNFVTNAFLVTDTDEYKELLGNIKKAFYNLYKEIFNINSRPYNIEVKSGETTISFIKVIKTIGQDPNCFHSVHARPPSITRFLSEYFTEEVFITLDPTKIYQVSLCFNIGYLYSLNRDQSESAHQVWRFFKTDQNIW